MVWPLKDFTCSICDVDGSGLLIMEDSGPVCMECAELDHLVFLASGDAALTRRARAGRSGKSVYLVRHCRAEGAGPQDLAEDTHG